MKVKDLQDRRLTFEVLTDDLRREILESVIFDYNIRDKKIIKAFKEELDDFDSCFLKVENGDFSQVFLKYGIIPYLENKVYDLDNIVRSYLE